MANVLIIGAVNVDLVIDVDTLPQAGETVVGPQMRRFGGGKGANAAVAAARAGAMVRFCGAVGADAMGDEALDSLRGEGIDLTDVRVLSDIATGTAMIVVDAKGENQIAVGAGANARVTPDQVRAAVARALGWADVVLISTEIPAEAAAAGVTSARQAGIACILNPAPVVPALAQVLRDGAILTPNATELSDLYGLIHPGKTASVEDMAQALLNVTNAPVLVTLGGEGVLFCAPGHPLERLAPPPVARVVDTTGAGDTFNGVLARRCAAGQPLLASARAAVVAATLSVTKTGARSGMPTAAALERALAGT